MSKESKKFLKALSSSKRREIMRNISEKGSATYTELMQVLGLNSSQSGTFNYHLKELSDSGLIERKNGDYMITDAGKSAMIFIDEIARETKDEALVDRYGVFSSVMRMQPEIEVKLFFSQMGMLFALIICFFGVFGIAKINVISLSLEEKIGDNVIWLGGVVLALGFLFLALLIAYFVVLIRKLKLEKSGVSLYLFLGRGWFLIRSPNRNRFFILYITSIGALACLGLMVFSFKPAPWLTLGIGFGVFTILTIVLFFLIRRNIKMRDKEIE